jgi:hypothetical protein
MISSSKRTRAWTRQNGKCCWCGRTVALECCTHEHILPRILGGTDAYENMAVSHLECNRLRSSNIWQDPHPSFLFDFVREELSRIRLKNSEPDGPLPKDTPMPVVRWSETAPC